MVYSGASASIPTEGPEPAVLVPKQPDLRWIRSQAESLSSGKDADAVGALAWNLLIYHRRLTDWHTPSQAQDGYEAATAAECARENPND